MSSRANLVLNTYKFILAIVFTFLIDDKYQIFKIACLLIGSTIVFIHFQFFNPFYSEVVIKAWSIMAALNLWTVLMLIFARIMMNSYFQETIFIWMLGIPLIIFINIYNVDKRMSDFLINAQKFQSGGEVISHIQYLLKLQGMKNSSNHASTMLDGYLEIHKQDCFSEQCPCRNKSRAFNNNRITRNLLSKLYLLML